MPEDSLQLLTASFTSGAGDERAALHWVLISFDTARDTPEVLPADEGAALIRTVLRP